MNIANLTTLITAYINREKFSDPNIAGKVLIGVKNDKRMIQGLYLKMQDIEKFSETLIPYIKKHTYPDIHSFVEIKHYEVIY